ncbi:MAG: 23S rRNA (adenine(2503)-C(2))-methyltransferase RlmN [Oscillospiraceae bacterium]|nr:23S rRNA (adenine(2503)-C(2))-methyltransferase RlmN [Oscillospiraceae bacterium]
MEKQDIQSMLPQEIEAVLLDVGEKPFRAKQIFQWLNRGVTDFNEMTNLSHVLREQLKERFHLTAPQLLEKQVSTDGTIKYLWAMADGEAVETVVMAYHHGNTVCISAQVGCRMGCGFCASAIGGLKRNLAPSELLAQVLFSQMESGRPISNIVLMGIGEPLDNLESVLRFLELVNHPDGMHIGMRHITISTCGLPEAIDKLASYHLQLTLSVSLHAPDDETRDRLMPANRGMGIDRLMAACRRYQDETGRRVSFEYAMIHGVNDTVQQAEHLARRMLDVGGHVNLIPLNTVAERDLGSSTKDAIKKFEQILRRRGVNVTLRRQLGGDIDASCGQLRRKQERARERRGYHDQLRTDGQGHCAKRQSGLLPD